MVHDQAEGEPSELTRFGLKIVHAALADPACGGGGIWLGRAAALSCAGQALVDAGHEAPLPGLFSLLNPAAIEPKLGFDPDPKRGQRPVGTLSLEAEVLDLWQSARNKEHGHKDVSTQPMPGDREEGAIRLKDLLGSLFDAYRDYRLAYVQTASDGQCVIQGVWNEGAQYRGWSRNNRPMLQALWGPARNGLLPAPHPPAPGLLGSEDWDGSLLLYHQDHPRERCLYLMPLGYLYQSRRTKKGEPLPGLTDSVDWKGRPGSGNYQVRSVTQKAYVAADESMPASGGAGGGRAPRTIEAIVGFIRERYRLDLPIPAQPAEPLPVRFELQHLEAALRLAEDSVRRDDEVERVLALARTAPGHRLLLTGPCGGGKSVLLAQIARTLGERNQPLVYLTMDYPPDPEEEPDAPGRGIAALRIAQAGGEPGGDLSGAAGSPMTPLAVDMPLAPGLDEGRPAKTIAVAVRMHLLASLARLAGRADALPSSPLGEQPCRRQVAALLEQLAKPRGGPVWVLIDALNQSVEPAALLSGLPRPLPDQVRLIASTQPIERVVQAVSDAGRNPWAQADLAAIGHDLTWDLVLFTWPLADRARLAEGLGADQVDALLGLLPTAWSPCRAISASPRGPSPAWSASTAPSACGA